MPHNVRSVVVLPAPFGPSNPRIWPGSTEKLRFFTAVKPLYCLLKFVTVIICSLLNVFRFAISRAGRFPFQRRSTRRSIAPIHVKSKFKTPAPNDFVSRSERNVRKHVIGGAVTSEDWHLGSAAYRKIRGKKRRPHLEDKPSSEERLNNPESTYETHSARKLHPSYP